MSSAPTVFISFNSADSAAADLLAGRLKQSDVPVWISQSNLEPGEGWQRSVEAAISNCTCCIVCIGPAGISKWQRAEIEVATDLQIQDPDRYRLIPVLMPGLLQMPRRSDLPTFLTRNEWVQLDYDFESTPAWEKLLRKIRDEPPPRTEPKATLSKECPYAGLKTFDVADAARFFGRSRLTEWLIGDMKAVLCSSARMRFLCLVGPSGSGKSSLARAGLIASLEKDAIPGSAAWRYSIFEPGKEPNVSLANAMSGEIPEGGRLFLLVDQFEQVFSLCKDLPQRSAFIQTLLDSAKSSDGPTIVVITVRADYYGEIAAFPDLAAAVADHQVLVSSMSDEELREAIERPAELAGRKVDRALVERLIAEVREQPGCLPLLQDTLVELWKRPRGPDLSLDAYRSIGTLERVLELRAEKIYTAFSPQEKRACSQVFRRLVEFSGEKYAKARVRREDLLPAGPNRKATEDVVAKLGGPDARLIAFQDDWVEVAHEALIRNWPRLRAWIDAANQQFLLWRRHLGVWLADWQAKQDPGYLLRGTQLEEAQKWRSDPDVELNPAELRFVEESSHRARKQRIEIVAAIAALALAIGAGVVHQLELHKADELAHFASDLLDQSRKPELALLLAAKAAKTEKYLQPWREWGDALSALEWAIQRNTDDSSDANNDQATCLAMAPNGDRLADAGADGTIRRWKIEKAAPIPEPGDPYKHDGVLTIAFDNQGKRLVSGGSDRTAKVWNNGGGNLVLPHPSSVSGVAWRPRHDNQVATVSEDGKLRLWTISGENGQLKWESESDGRRLNCVAFTDDGEFMVTGGASKTLKYWNPETAKIIGREVPLTEEPVSIDISSDKNYVVLGGVKGALMAVERRATTPEMLEDPYEKQERKITAVHFLDNDRLASASSDGTIRVWRLHDHQRLMTLRASDARGFFGIAYDSADQTLFGAQESTSVRVFRLRPEILLEFAKGQLGNLKNNIDPKDCALYHVDCP